MRRLACAVLLCALSFIANAAFSNAAQARIVITVDKSAQELTVNVDGMTQHRWPVSTGRWGYNTPTGTFRPQRLERQWYSRKYDWSPMPYSIFFAGGYAIHGSNEISRLGRPASHGCIRLHPRNAAVLFDLVQRNRSAVRIDIVGSRPDAMVEKRTPRAGSRVVYDQPRVSQRRVVVIDERPARRVSSRDASFEEIFVEPPRYRSRRAARWDDF